MEKLREVATIFGQLQDDRRVADYDHGTEWTHAEALRGVETASRAFSIWPSIRDEKIAQDYLVSLLIRPR